MNVLYTIGSGESYETAISQGGVKKLGRRPTAAAPDADAYAGGIAFLTVVDAHAYIETHPAYHGYGVFGLATTETNTLFDPDIGALRIIDDCLIIPAI